MKSAQLKLISPAILLLLSFAAGGQTPSATNAKRPGNVTGHYRMRREEFRNRIDVEQLTDGKIKFDLVALWVSHYNPENVHNGTLQGIARMENGVAIYEANSCKLKLEFFPGRVRITQSEEVGDCEFGANVTATGTYRKADNRRPKFDF
jgi:hypothetical protein